MEDPVATTTVNQRFLLACRSEPSDRVPVWFMRQAGRCLPEYNAIRAEHTLLEICRIPELAAEVTMQPVRRFGVDAAILFSDIMVPLVGVGIDLEIREGVGPVIAEPIRHRSDLARLRPLDAAADLPHVAETIRLLVSSLDIPLIGFSGAPFTLACYLVEGGPSRDQARTRALMRSTPEVFEQLMARLTDIVTAHLLAQIEAGAAAVQLFDSWVGSLSGEDYERYVQPHSRRILDTLAATGVPRIHFGIGTGEFLDRMAQGADVVGVDWRVPLDVARLRTGGKVALQGNLDPTTVLAGWDAIEPAAHDVLRRGGGRGHIFNLGHGVLPDTDPDMLARLVDLVHSWTPG